MALIENRNKLYFIIAASILLIILIFALYPKKIEHAVYIGRSNNKSIFLVKGKELQFETSDLKFEKYSVIDFSYNFFKAFDFKKVDAIKERIMTKNNNTYDLEVSGLQQVSSNATYYKIDKNNSLSLAKSSNVIVGKYNVLSYKNKKGLLNTFIILPMNYSSMRVAISDTNFNSVYHKQVTIQALSNLKLYSRREKYSSEIPKAASLSFSLHNGKLRLSADDLTRELSDRLYIEGSGIEIKNITREEGLHPIYSGIIELSASENGILIINEINIDEYLKKVVPSEMASNSGIEALKCQAIAARTYAISDMLTNRFAALGFYVDDSTKSQVYNNISSQPKSNEAVTDTKGMVLTYKGQPIDAKYYSTSCGTGTNYSDIWFKSDGSSDWKPYLKTSNYLDGDRLLPRREEEWLDFYKERNIKAVDSVSPYFRWRISYPSYALAKTLNRSLASLFKDKKDFMTIKQNNKTVDFLPELKKLNNVEVLKRSDGGNVVKLAFEFENAVVEISGDASIRRAVKCSKEYAGITVSIIKQDGKAVKNIDSLLSSFFSVEKSGDNFIFYGGGFGHGVGMSQYGAMEMAKDGIDYKTIINTFYKDVQIAQLY